MHFGTIASLSVYIYTHRESGIHAIGWWTEAICITVPKIQMEESLASEVMRVSYAWISLTNTRLRIHSSTNLMNTTYVSVLR